LEAGKATPQPDFWNFAEGWVKATLLKVDPNFENLLQSPSAPIQNGAMVRWSDYSYPSFYQVKPFNPELMVAYKSNVNNQYSYSYSPGDFGDTGQLSPNWKSSNCPGPYYFAPPRKHLPSGILTTNLAVCPEMRLFGMKQCVANLVGDQYDDIQWRYDTLHAELLKYISPKNYITKDEARAAIDFLAPYGAFREYYNSQGETDMNKIQIQGATALMDLTERSIEVHYGYFGDKWLKINLANYLVATARLI